jgi:hypothetical protein
LLDEFHVPLKRLPLACALLRPNPGPPYEKAECFFRLKSHLGCALNDWPNMHAPQVAICSVLCSFSSSFSEKAKIKSNDTNIQKST